MPEDFSTAIEALTKRANEGDDDLSGAIQAFGQRAQQPEGEPTQQAPGAIPQAADPYAPFQPDFEPPATYRSAQEVGMDETEGSSLFGKAMDRLFGLDVNDPLPWTRTTSTIAGGIGGSIYGSQIPGNPVVKGLGALAGGLAGTMVGAAAPETTMEALETLGIIDKGTRDKLGLSDEDLMTVIEGEALLEAFTAGGISAVRLGSRGLTNLFTGATKETRKLAEYGTREGLSLLPVQVGEGKFARGFVSVLGRFPWMAGPLRNRASKTMDQFKTAFEGIPKRFGPLSTMDATSGAILREAKTTVGAIDRHFAKQFEDILAKADTNFLRVRPVKTRAVTERLLKHLARETPQGLEGTRGKLPEGHQALQKFLRENTAIMFEGTAIADQRVRQMYTLLQRIDEQIVKAASKSDATTMGRFEQLRQAIDMDIVSNTFSMNKNNGQAALELINDFRAADTELTETINALLGNSTASRLGIKVSPTMRSARFANLGTRGIDSLANVLLRDGTPSAVEELAALVPPKTLRQLTGAVFNQALEKSYIREQGRFLKFDVNAFSKELGLDVKGSPKYRQTERMLQLSGGMTMDALDNLVEVGRRAAGFEIPDVSTFVARGAVFSGLGRMWNTIIPGLLIGGATHTAGTNGFALGLLTILGSRGMSAMISDPKSARALKHVLNDEVGVVIKRAAYTRAGVFATYKMIEDGIITNEEANNILHALASYGDHFVDEYKRAEQNAK